MEINAFLAEIMEANPRADSPEIRKAYNFAKNIYGKTKRMSGQTVISHCLDIALSVARFNLDTLSIQAAILHEVIEKFNISKKDLEKEFNAELANIVEGISNVSKIEHHGAERSIENLRKLFLAMGEDLRVIIIKLINRTHGLQTLHVFSREKQKRIALESLDIYASLAHRLGMGKIQAQTEDLAFPYAYPLQYQWLIDKVKYEYPLRQKEIERVQKTIQDEIAKENIKIVSSEGRVKHLYSLWRKLQKYDMDISRIYDLIALRIIVSSVEDCYRTLGAIHHIYKPLHGRIKDYIASPKPNGYQSLHTTVFCQNGEVVEIQIRTEEMNNKAEYGIANHWYYKEKTGIVNYLRKIFGHSPEKELRWVQELRQRQEEATKDNNSVEDLKIDFFKDRIFVFTPRGDVIDLPNNATPVDFAYKIHTNLGDTCTGATINGKMASLDKKLSSGDVVEIINQKTAHPNRRWLQFIVTSLAKSRIKSYIKRTREQDIPSSKEKQILPVGLSKKNKRELLKKRPHKIKKERIGIKNVGQILTRTAFCCEPTFPESIVGYITATRGLIVHRADCPNMKKNKKKERIFPLDWENK